MEQLERIAKELRKFSEAAGKAASALEGSDHRRGRVLSLGARKRIAAAQRARWAKWKRRKAA
jgi:hypothetical protein